LPVKVCTRTIARVLAEEGLPSRVAAKKPFLSDRHRAARLAFAKMHKDWSVEDWKRVLWTDESTFEIGRNSRQIRVRREPHEKYHPDCLAPTFRNERSSLMVWGGICGEDKTRLAFMPPQRRSAADFVELVYEGPLREFLAEGRDILLMEDGAPVHRSAASRIWREDKNLEKLDWPAQSPDLNPIENLWSLLKSNIQSRNPRVNSVEQMREAVQKEWEKLSMVNWKHLIEIMPARMAAVIANKGGSVRW